MSARSINAALFAMMVINLVSLPAVLGEPHSTTHLAKEIVDGTGFSKRRLSVDHGQPHGLCYEISKYVAVQQYCRRIEQEDEMRTVLVKKEQKTVGCGLLNAAAACADHGFEPCKEEMCKELMVGHKGVNVGYAETVLCCREEDVIFSHTETKFECSFLSFKHCPETCAGNCVAPITFMGTVLLPACIRCFLQCGILGSTCSDTTACPGPGHKCCECTTPFPPGIVAGTCAAFDLDYHCPDGMERDLTVPLDTPMACDNQGNCEIICCVPVPSGRVGANAGPNLISPRADELNEDLEGAIDELKEYDANLPNVNQQRKQRR